MSNAIHIELNALCLLILCFIAYQSHNNVNQQMKRILFRATVYGIIVQLVLDTLWILVEGRIFPGAVAANRIINALYLGTTVCMGCVWYLYVLDTIGYTVDRRLHTIVMLPGIVFMLFNILSIWTGWVFTVSEANVYAHAELFWVQMVGAYGMLAISLLHLVVRFLRLCWKKAPRRDVGKLLCFYIIPAIGSIGSIFYTGMPGAWTCGAISIVLIYLDDMDREILRDSLTGLNNRHALDAAFGDYAALPSAENQLYMFMMDLDDFKQINDTLGHSVGDQALVDTGKLLTGCMKGMRGVLARYGGDEFAVMALFEEAAGAEAYMRTVREAFAAFGNAGDRPYRLGISVGSARYAGGMTLTELIKAADAELYADKQRRKKGRISA